MRPLRKDDKAPVDVESKAPDQLQAHPIFSGGRYGLMSADAPRFPAKVEGGSHALEERLKKEGLQYEKTVGMYDGPEQSFIVHNPSREQMLKLGSDFGQESVIWGAGGNHEFHYTAGPNAGMFVQGHPQQSISYFEHRPSNFWTAMPNDMGFFRLNFDPEWKMRPGTELKAGAVLKSEDKPKKIGEDLDRAGARKLAEWWNANHVDNHFVRPSSKLPAAGKKRYDVVREPVKKEEDDTSFNFGANVPPGMHQPKPGWVAQHTEQKKLQAVQRLKGMNRQIAEIFHAYASGKIPTRPDISPDLERHLGRHGIVDPKGFPFEESGRDMRRRIPGPRRQGRGEEPRDLNRFRLMNQGRDPGYVKAELDIVDLAKAMPLDKGFPNKNRPELIGNSQGPNGPIDAIHRGNRVPCWKCKQPTTAQPDQIRADGYSAFKCNRCVKEEHLSSSKLAAAASNTAPFPRKSYPRSSGSIERPPSRLELIQRAAQRDQKTRALADLLDESGLEKSELDTWRPHPHAYEWHDGHTDHHTGLIKADEHPHTSSFPKNDQAAGVGVSTYAQHAEPYGTVTPGVKTNLLHYPMHGQAENAKQLVRAHGYEPYYAGGPHGKPDLARRPDSGASFNDQGYTDAWRHLHELAHAETYPQLNQIYGEGRRIGKLGVHRNMREAQRAVHWEWLAAHKQRELAAQMGIHIPDDTFNKEVNTVMHDAVHRAVTGQFTEPSGEGFLPHAHKVPLETALGMIQEAGSNLGLQGPDDLLQRKSETMTTANPLAALRKAVLERLKKTEADLIELAEREATATRLKAPPADPVMAKAEAVIKSMPEHARQDYANRFGYTHRWYRDLNKSAPADEIGAPESKDYRSARDAQLMKHLAEGYAKADKLSKGLGGPHMEPGVHENAAAGAAPHSEPGGHEMASLPTPDAPPASPVGASTASAGVPTGEVAPSPLAQPAPMAADPAGDPTQQPASVNAELCPLCGNADMPGQCTCLPGQDQMAAPPAAEGMAMSEGVQKNAMMGYGAGSPGAMSPAGGNQPMTMSDKEPSSQPSTSVAAPMAMAEMCAKCNMKHELGKCSDGLNPKPGDDQGMMKADDYVANDGSKKTVGVVGKLPPKGPDGDLGAGMAGAASKEMSPAGSGGDPKKNDKALKAEPPMAKPPSGKNPGTMVPTSKPAAMKAEELSKPPVSEAQRRAMGAAAGGNSTLGIPKKVGKEFIDADKGGKLPETKKQELDKAALPAAPKAQMAQHAQIASSKAAAPAAGAAAPGAKPAMPTPAQHAGRAQAFGAAQAGAFQPKGPVVSGLSLAPKKPAGMMAPPGAMRSPTGPGPAAKSPFGKNEKCVFCNRSEHPGECKP